MKKQALFLSAFLVFSASLAAADANPLYEELSRAKEVKVFVKTPADSGATKLDSEHFKKALEEALKTRKSIHFTPVAAETDAQYVIEPDIKGFLFSLTDPVDMLMGVAEAAMDAAQIDHFAAMDTHFIVREASGKVRWEGVVHTSITDHTITEAESREKILDSSAAMLMRDAFGRKKND